MHGPEAIKLFLEPHSAKLRLWGVFGSLTSTLNAAGQAPTITIRTNLRWKPTSQEVELGHFTFMLPSDSGQMLCNPAASAASGILEV